MVLAQKPEVFPLLTSSLKLCLAHYCDTHGPTPLMVTEGLPVPCSRCYNDSAEPDRLQSSQTSVADALRKMTLSASRSSSTSTTNTSTTDQDAQTHRAALLRASKLAPSTTPQSVTTNVPPMATSAMETPPQSPRKAPEGFPETNPNSNSKSGVRRDPSFRKTYDEYVTKSQGPCENCALTLPKRVDATTTKEKNAKTTDSKSDQHGPTLRTRAPYARVYGGNGDASPPSSNPQSSCTSDAEEDICPRDNTLRPSAIRRPTTSTSQSSVSSRSSVSHHTHYLDYTSTHEPTIPDTYSIVRASCLRTLSFETLPRRPESSQSTPSLPSPVSNMAPPYPPRMPSAMGHSSSNSGSTGYITSPPTPQSAASSGGPIFFGDPTAGYTTAYIFRIPDIHARGRKRVYAFLALTTHRERLAMKAFAFISAAFRDLANWIQDLAEAEAERERERQEEGSAVAALNAAYGSGSGPRDSSIGLGGGAGGAGGGLSGNSTRDRRSDSTSSFLSGGGRGGGYMHRMGGSMGPGGFAPKSRGLAEVVGLPDFFIELHTRFVKLLLELGVVLGS
ncbi:vesicle coat protein [Xylariomycetidae sp. FL0641]|nr:vesicle coat protein [Xylariomycetidae sp. FL0641]